jgi:hypothetical protein
MKQLPLFAPEPRANVHRCHAVDCDEPVPPEMLMCKPHWRMVPRELQRRVWATYRDGQCDDRSPSYSWHAAADRAIAAVALAEGRTKAARHYTESAGRWDAQMRAERWEV